jgi:hypothetical protein
VIIPERPANGGLLRISHRSPGYDFGHSLSEIAHSLRRIFEIFPFSGDRGRRLGSICTAWASLQCNLQTSLPWPAANWESRARTSAPSLQCNSPDSPPWPPANLECPARAAAPSLWCSFAKFYALATGKLGTSTLHCRVRYNPFPFQGPIPCAPTMFKGFLSPYRFFPQ